MYGNMYLSILIGSIALLPIMFDILEQKFMLVETSSKLHLFVDPIKAKQRVTLADCLKDRFQLLAAYFDHSPGALQSPGQFQDQFQLYNSSYNLYQKIQLEINSKLTNNLIIIQPPYNTVYQISYQNREFMKATANEFSYVIVQKLVNHEIFEE